MINDEFFQIEQLLIPLYGNRVHNTGYEHPSRVSGRQ